MKNNSIKLFFIFSCLLILYFSLKCNIMKDNLYALLPKKTVKIIIQLANDGWLGNIYHLIFIEVINKGNKLHKNATKFLWNISWFGEKSPIWPVISIKMHIRLQGVTTCWLLWVTADIFMFTSTWLLHTCLGFKMILPSCQALFIDYCNRCQH